MNQGNTAEPHRQDLFAGTLGVPVGIPAIGVSYPIGELADGRRPEAHIVDRDRLGDPGDLQRHRRDQGQRARTSSWPAPTSTACSRARASTTTAPAAPRCSRPPRRWPTRRQAQQPGALRLVGRRGARPARVGALRRRPVREQARQVPEHRALPELRHGRLAQLHARRVRRRQRRVPAGGVRGRARRVRPRSRGCSRRSSTARHRLGRRPRSAAAATTGRSSRSTSRPAVCSPAPRASRPPSRPRCSAAPPARRTTSATTRSATTSATSTGPRSVPTPAAIVHSVMKYARSTKSVNGNDTGHEPPPAAASAGPRHRAPHPRGGRSLITLTTRAPGLGPGAFVVSQPQSSSSARVSVHASVVGSTTAKWSPSTSTQRRRRRRSPSPRRRSASDWSIGTIASPVPCDAPHRHVERHHPDRVDVGVVRPGRVAEERLDRPAAQPRLVGRLQVEHAGLGDDVGQPAARGGPGHQVAAGGVAHPDDGLASPARRRRPPGRRPACRRRRCRGGTRSPRSPSRLRPGSVRVAARTRCRTPASRTRRARR